MPGKLIENTKIVQAFAAERLTSATVYWNGGAVTTRAGRMTDTRDYDQLHVVLNLGTVLGEVATLSNAIYESDTDDPTAATLITGASFTDVYSGNDEGVQEASILVKNYKRYVSLRTEVKTTSDIPLTIDFGAIMILGSPDVAAVSKTAVFDLNG